MTRFARSLLSSALVLSLALGAGCGGGDDDEPASSESKVESDGSASVLGSAKCRAAAEAMGKAASAVPQAFTGKASDDLETTLEEFEEFADAAPSEIRADMKVVARGYAVWVDAYVSSGFDPAKPSQEAIEKLQAASEKLDDEEFKEAADRVNAWFTAQCNA